MKTADWYFDFISPFAYLQCEALERLASSVDIRYQPILFAGLLKHYGQLGPAEIAPKRAFTYRYVMWRAATLGIPMQLPPAHPFNPLKALRLALACDGRPAAVRIIFRYLWRDGRSLQNQADFETLCEQLNIDPASLSEPALKQRLMSQGSRAIEAGVFGVPTLVIDDQVFWGEDATEMALDYLKHPEHFVSTYATPAQTIPIGISRKV